jgi:hypothetical protein
VQTPATVSHLARVIPVLFRTLAARWRHAVVVLAVLGVGCATGSGGTNAAGPVRLEVPDDGCEPLGSLGVRMSTELLLPEDSLFDTAVTELRRRAALRGATHLVLATPPTHGSLAYGTTAVAAGFAYRCPEQR